MQDETDVTPSQTNIPPRKNAGRRSLYIVSAALLIAGCFAAGFFGSLLSFQFKNYTTSQQLTGSNDGNKIVTKDEVDISDVVQKVSPSVVSIVTSLTKSSAYQGAQEYQGAGTGIIVGANGYIVTNKHVVEGADTVSVVLSNGTSYDNVKVIGTDPLNDVAFLKIPNVSDLPAAELGDSKTIRIGQRVIAIGNALGQYQNTVTSGIISGTGRPVSAQSSNGVLETLNDLIQTDAAINSGNSGGPLLNLKGQVIGINTAVAEGAQSIGFSIPVAAVKGMLKGVLAGGNVEHPYLGIAYVSITPDVASERKLPVKKGSYVVSSNDSPAIVIGGPADKAGVKENDIITKVNGVEIGDIGSVSSLVAEYSVGDTIKLTILRDGKAITLDVTLAAYSK